jgi:diguanylate cyclase (GGDEF)-like protein
MGSILAELAAIANTAQSTAEAESALCRVLGELGAEHVVLLHQAAESDAIDGAVSDKLGRTDLIAVSTVLLGLTADIDRDAVDVLAPGAVYVPGLGHCYLMAVPLRLAETSDSWVVLLKTGSRGFAKTLAGQVRDLVTPMQMLLRQIQAEDDNRHQRAERATIARLTQAVVAMQGVHSVFDEVASSIRGLSGWDTCTVATLNPDAGALSVDSVDVSADYSVAAPWGERIELDDWRGLRFAIENCSPYRLSLDLPESLSVHEARMMKELGLHIVLAVPFAVKAEPLGLILLTSSAPRKLDTRMLKTIEDVCLNTALAVQHHQYLEQTRIQSEEQSALIRVSQAVSSGRELSVILAEVARACLQFDGVEGCRILLWQKEIDQFEIAAVQHHRDWQMYYRHGDRYPAADWPSVKAVMQSRVGRGLLVTDSEVNARERYNHAADHIQSFHSFPIIVGEEAVGALTLLSRERRRFSVHAVRAGQEMAAQAANAIDRANLFRQLRQRAETDGLTGLLNHRAAFETLDRELAVARKQQELVSIIVVDLDDFKFFNDTHGHLTGDKVLIEISGVLRSIARSRDHVARFGGDEFLMILPNTPASTAGAVADRLLRSVDQATVSVGELTLPIRISVGLATFPNDARNRQELIAYADAAMYSAKELGGGQVGSIEKGTRSLEVTVFGALSGLVRAVDRKDRYTKDHSDLVAEYAVRFGRYLQLPAEQIEALDLAGQLHDVGKIAVPDSVLRKPGHLNPEEEALIRQHVVFSELIIKGVPNLDYIVDAVANHHERWDGTGYPYQREGKEIPLMGRILALADALAAMTHDRPYRKARSLEEAVIEIHRGSGTQFDPDLVEPFVSSVSTGSALLRDVNRRKRFESSFEGQGEEPVGLTDYLRKRAERRQSEALTS